MKVIDYITITCNKKKSDYRLHPNTCYDYPMSGWESMHRSFS